MDISEPKGFARSTSEATILVDRQPSPLPLSSVAQHSPESAAIDGHLLSPQDSREDATTVKSEGSSSGSRIKKKFSELDIRGAMADLDIRKSSKRSGVEDFYIQLDEPLRLFWCPGDVVKGLLSLLWISAKSLKVRSI
jgi:hypothetical protein